MKTKQIPARLRGKSKSPVTNPHDTNHSPFLGGGGGGEDGAGRGGGGGATQSIHGTSHSMHAGHPDMGPGLAFTLPVLQGNLVYDMHGGEVYMCIKTERDQFQSSRINWHGDSVYLYQIGIRAKK
jgi:hypothetical protein